MLRVWGIGRSSVTITTSVSSGCSAPRGLWPSFATLKEKMTRKRQVNHILLWYYVAEYYYFVFSEGKSWKLFALHATNIQSSQRLHVQNT
jgi:hypothetical protein